MSISATKVTNHGPELRGSVITLDGILKKGNINNRQTKIICTMGPACWDILALEELIDAGMNVARFNFSHGTHPTHQQCYDNLKQAASNKRKHIAVMLDTQGPEIRTGLLEESTRSTSNDDVENTEGTSTDKKLIHLIRGETIIITSDYTYVGNNKKIACSYSQLADIVSYGQKIFIADGSLVLSVLQTNAPIIGEVTCRIENNASIGERKNMTFPGLAVDLPTLTAKDKMDILKWAIPNEVDYIAASFVQKASDVLHIRYLLGDDNKKIKIICKIENQEGLKNFDSILQVADGIMVARGTLGMEIPPQKVFLAQKMMIRMANVAGKPVVTATQMLESMISAPRPTRAECSDVANAVLDGTDCVMLSGETAIGGYPVNAVRIMSQTCVEAESAQDTDKLYQAVRSSTLQKYGQLSISESIASSAVKTSIDVGAKAIIVVSETGTTARQVAKFRPGRPIMVITANEQIARQCYGLLRSCEAYVIENIAVMDQAIEDCIVNFVLNGICQKGDAVVVITGTVRHHGSTNLMRIHYAK